MVISRRVRIVLLVSGAIFLTLAAVTTFLILRFQPIARSYVMSALRERYKSEIELGDLQISLFPTVHATGENLVFRFRGRRDIPPMIQVRRFTFDARFIGFFRKPKHIRLLRLEGLEIKLQPREVTGGQPDTPQNAPRSPFILDEVIADGTILETTPKDPTKDPLIFDIRKLNLRTVGLGEAMTFRAELTNPKPPGLIHSDGRFGPWNAGQPSDTQVSGKYTFRNADLSVFHGIAGTLSSDGSYKGELDTIEVEGTTDIPDFVLTSGGHPMHLQTKFNATVDGTDGDTILHPVRAQLGQSMFEVSGAIDRGALEKHKTILLEAKAGSARLEDFLRLSVKSARPPMTGLIRFDSKVRIPPGETDVVERLQLDGMFALNGVRFTSPDVQQKIANLSHHAEGDPKDQDPNVAADFKGRFRLRNGRMDLPDLRFTVPGATIDIKGNYGLRTGDLDFRGTARLDATVSQMATGFKKLLLKPIDPLFKRDGAGAVVPITISGTRGSPSFKLDIGRVIKRN